MAHAGKLYLYETASARRTHEVPQAGLDVFFPDGIGWTEVLDCRIPPYDSRSIGANCEYAVHQRKVYILVTEESVAQSTPPTAAGSEA